jgi:Uma2 family endonuclease
LIVDAIDTLRHNHAMAMQQRKISLQEYLAWENEQPDRNEFLNGEVFAMVGALRVHSTLVGNLHVALHNFLRGKLCRPFSESAKLQVGNSIFYPDVFVTCDARDLKTEQIFFHPTLICEVLSPSTEHYDRGQKFAAYRQIESLQEYLVLHPTSKEVTLFRRNAAGRFELHDFTGAEFVYFASIDCQVAEADLFDGL